MPTNELPSQAADEIKAAIADLRAYIERTLNGSTRDGVFSPGIMPTMQDHARRLAALENGRSYWKERAVSIAMSVAAAVASAFALGKIGGSH